MISAVLIYYGAEYDNFVEPCLKTIHWVDEIVVVKGPHVTPYALALFKKYGAKVYAEHTNSFAGNRNLADKKATGDWILHIDSDERVSKELKDEIVKRVESGDKSAYQIRRVNYHLGKKVRYGDRYPDYITRLFKKSSFDRWTGDVHESSRVDGEIGKIDAPLYHLTHWDIFSMLDKTKNFAQHEAMLRLKSNHPPVVGWRLVRVFLTEFYNRIIKLQGFRQGTEGWIDGVFQAFSMFVVYARLWELQRKPSLEDSYKAIDHKILEEWT